MSAPAGGAGSAAAAAAPEVTIYTTSTLPEAYPDKDDADARAEREWKRYLFYVLGYCDTFHDFAKPRTTEDTKKEISLPLPVKAAVRAQFILDKVIDVMDPSINFRGIYSTITGGNTFEKSMYATFTNLTANPLITALDETYAEQIQAHISNVHSIPQGCAFQDIKIPDGGKYFSARAPPGAAAAAPLPDSSIIELRLPAIEYSDAWQNNFINFLHKIFPNCVTGGRLKIVEDTATFPRSLFTNFPTNFARFQKLDIPQTRWDPAGLTQLESQRLEMPNINVSASSFRSLQTFSTNTNQQFSKENAYFVQNAGKSSLILPGQVPARIDNLNAGPTVNHLFMHIVVHSDLVSLFTGMPAATIASKSEILKNQAKEYLKPANPPVKSGKNTTLRLVEPRQGEVSNPALLRKYTTSKRTGDYENTNAAKYHNAVLFCGDEPEFVYAMLNEQPAIYHTHDAGGHKFRMNLPKSFGLSLEDQAAREKEQTVISYAHKAFEFTRLFTNVKEFVLEYFNNITTVFSKPLIQFSTSGTEYTDLFKYIIHTHILSNTKIIKELQKSYTKFGELSSIITARLSRYSITQLELDDLGKLKSALLSKVEDKAEVQGIQREIKTLDVSLAAVIKLIPRSLNITQTSAAPNMAYAFREVEENELFYTKDAGGGGGGGGEGGEGGEEFPKGWIIDSALFPTLNSLNEIMPKIINSIIFINRYTGQENLARTIKINVKTEKIKINDILKGFGIKDGFFEAKPEVKQASYTEAASELNELIRLFTSQGGGTTQATHNRNTRRIRSRLTKDIRHAGHAGHPAHKKSRRQSKHLANTTIDLDKMQPEEFYKFIKESIVKLGDAPFGLKSEEYANQIICRMIIIDSINEILSPSISPKRVPKHRLDPLPTSDHTAHKIISTPKKPKMQKGGALTAEDHLVWYKIYIEMLIPIWDTLHRNAPFSPRESILISIINGSFLESVLPFLEELSLINKTGNPVIDGIIDVSIEAFGTINKRIDYSFNNEYYISLPKRFSVETTGLTGKDINYIINTRESGYFKLANDQYEAQDLLFKNVLDYMNFLNSILKYKKIDTEWSEQDKTTFDGKIDELGAIDTEEEYIAYMKSNMAYMNKNIRWIFQLYYNLFYFDQYEGEGEKGEPIKVDESDIYRDAEEEETAEDSELVAGAEASEAPAAAAAAAPAGGAASSETTSKTMGGGRRRIAGHERKRGKRRSSPRRLSLKNR
jgi:hypothetical protein